MPEKLNLYQKLEKIRSMCDVAKKTKEGYNYKYVDITEILANVTAGMQKYGVFLIPAMLPDSASVEQNVVRNTKFDRSGKSYEAVSTEMLFKSNMTYTWVDSDNPDDKIEVPWFITGAMPDSSQSLGAACSYGLRQFLTSFFQIAQSENDVDAYRSKQREAADAENIAIAKGIIKSLDTMVHDYLKKNKSKRDECVEFMSKYVKGGNYNNIKEPRLAAKLLEDFKATYIEPAVEPQEG